MAELAIVKLARRGPKWVLRFWEADVMHPYQVQIQDAIRDWLDGCCPGWRWKTAEPRNSLGYWARYEWYRPEIQAGQMVDIIFPDRESLLAFQLTWCRA
jgi:hypothetical protein